MVICNWIIKGFHILSNFESDLMLSSGKHCTEGR